LRCGGFVERRLALGPRLAICGACAFHPRIGLDPILFTASRHVMRRRSAVAVVPFVALCVTIARNISVPALLRWWESLLDPARPVVIGLAGLGLLVLLLVPTWIALWIPSADARGKKELIDRLKLAPRTAAQLTLCIYCRGPLRAQDIRNNIEMGLLAWGPDGLALFGADGRRVLLRASELIHAEKKHMIFLFPPRNALRVVTRHGIEHSFAPVERGSAAANTTLIDEMVARLNVSTQTHTQVPQLGHPAF
jgi:hypothetical protein